MYRVALHSVITGNTLYDGPFDTYDEALAAAARRVSRVWRGYHIERKVPGIGWVLADDDTEE